MSEFKKAFPNARFILYMWDSFKNKQALDLIDEFENIYSFDPNDCKTYNVIFRPLFFLDIYSATTSKNNAYDLLFIGTAHTDRYKFVKKTVSRLSKKLDIKLFFYLSSKRLYLIKKIFEKDFRVVRYKDISFNSLTLKDNAQLLKQAKLVLDINHPQQIGLTMRSIETLGAQKKLITTNKDILNYDFYNENNVLVIDRVNPIIPESFVQSPFLATEKEILYKYSLNGWIDEIFN
ncbi:hypothetical protein I5M32_14125 [Pedobacter sp. SD-b]|uniref:Uncharacterized protein n=1 Tax=Pedobacter segetis TaxID=2793069 RepID=A0ABS1BMJ2_9SPHI|nr:hypothetical protein [Pedobacter segetis]MBK0384103.1 hypothetical protein [Pedobacter segetis]